LVNPIPAGFSLRASIVPQAGRLSADLGLAAGEGDNVYTFNRTTQGYESYGFSFGEWSPSDPNVGVAESFWYENVNAAQSWTRTFSVN
jgi:hypothetical protein